MPAPASFSSGKAPAFAERQLTAFRHLRRFREALARAQQSVPVHSSFADPKRRLELGDYRCLFLMGLFNPVARTLRGLVQASAFPKMQREVCSRPVSLGSFSEIQSLVDPALLEVIFAQLAAEIPHGSALPTPLRTQQWMARDGSLFAALAAHDYDMRGNRRGDMQRLARGRPVWMTEWCARDADESPGQINSGLSYASAMHDAFSGGANVWMAYDWVYPPRKGGEALIHVDRGNEIEHEQAHDANQAR